MKNLIYALALLISFSSFGQEYGTSSITNFSPELDKCSEEFLVSDKELLENYKSFIITMLDHKKLLDPENKTLN